MAQPKLGMKRINVFLDPNVIDGYKWLAKARKTTYSELLRAAAKEYLLREIKIEQENVELLAEVTQGDAA